MVSPVAGLTLTRTHPAGAFAAYTATERTQPVVFRARGVTIPSVDTAYLLLEMGATGAGMGVWYQTGVIKARCGSGGGSTSNTDHAFAESAVTKGSTVDITVEFDPANRRLRMWFGEALVGNATSSQAFAEWAGGDAAGYGSTGSSTPTGVPTTSWPSPLPNALEAYVNQRSTWTEGGAAEITGSGSGGFTTTGSGAGSVQATENAGAGAGSFTTGATGSGKADVSGTGSGGFTSTGSGSGASEAAGTGTGGFDTTGSGTGVAEGAGAGAGGFDTSGTGEGTAEQPAGSGSGFGSFDTDAGGAGSVGVGGTGSGGFDSTASGGGTSEVSGSSAGSFDAEGTGAGGAEVRGTGAAGFTSAGTGAGGVASSFEPAGLPPLSRTIVPAFERRDIMAGSNVTQWPNKDPDDILDYAIDWSDLIGDDTIASHEWVVQDGIKLDRFELSGNVAIAWLSGGVAVRSYRITSRITTAAGRRIDRSASLLVVPR
ncbi:phage fiber-tail adaptor protein [Limimaricola cinnabarinus]|uniref:Uncharacterized protein n=1 Tax=Limimaricola cinnabarinus LL-001 TaxID=1337093 RepID=U2Z363_9RHOB|nr:hypothetical protein [Limimaricola cinnabarinus]GAD55507.1 hypothetical protein MBELCI_1559 [Limimaricola cinnabarinus LL-001]